MRGTARLWALIGTTARIVRREGVLSALRRLGRWLRGERGYYRQLHAVSLPYAEFKRRTALSQRALKRQSRDAAKGSDDARGIVLITIDRGEGDLEATAASLRNQYTPWRWVIVTNQSVALDDARIGFIRSGSDAENLQAVNALLADERYGSPDGFVAFIEAGDALTPIALFDIDKVIRDTHPTVVYSDSEIVHSDNAEDAKLKPDWSPEMMLSVNLLDSIAVFDRSMLVKAGGVRDLTPVAGMWELGLRISRSIDAKQIVHLPHIVYRQVIREDFPAEECATVIADHLRAVGVNQPQVSFSGRRSICQWKPKDARSISIIIPTRDLPDVLGACLKSIFALTQDTPFEVILVDTGSTDPAIPALYATYTSRDNFRVLRDDAPFNFSRVCNIGARASQGDLLLFLNNDTQVLQSDWLERMAQWFDLTGVGMVGAKLLYPNGLIQHAGVIVGIHGLADNFMAGMPEHNQTVFGSDDLYRNLSAVTGACAMIRRDVFEQVGGFDERYRLNFSDVQLGVDVNRAGYRVVYTPDVRLIHHESLTHQRRIPEEDIPLGKRLLAAEIKHDPFYHQNLSRLVPQAMLTLRGSRRSY